MKKQAYRIFTTLGLLLTLAGTSAYAQMDGQTLRAEIPFDFVIGSKTLPAGEYNVSNRASTATTDMIKIISADSNQAGAFTMTLPVGAKGHESAGQLVFHRYGDEYFLAQIWAPGARDGMQLSKSRRERSLEKEIKTAMSQTPLETVTVAALIR